MTLSEPALIMIQGPDPGSVYRLPDNRVTTIGRSSQNTVPVVVRAVSRFHAEVACVNGKWELTDLNSRRGTMVNGEWVKGRVQLDFGDIIRMSSVMFRFDDYDDRIGEQGALLAIKEAELDKKLVKKGEASFDLEDIMMRSRLESQSRLEERAALRIGRQANKVFVSTSAVAIFGLLCIVMAWAYGVIPGLKGVSHAGMTAGEPTPANETQGDDQQPKGPTLQELAATRLARQEREARQWREIQSTRETLLAAYRRSDFAAAFKALDEVATDGMSKDMLAALNEEKEQALAMAKAFFNERMLHAEDLASNGQTQEAARTCEQVAASVGIKELADRAAERAAHFNKSRD